MSLIVTIENYSLTDYQKQIVKVVYDEIKPMISSIIDEFKQMNIENVSPEDISKKIFVIISTCIKIIEKTKVNNKKIEGSDKKQIVLELGKIIINTEIDNTSITDVINPIYDSLAEEVLETLIDVSSHVNTEVKKGCLVLFVNLKEKLSQCLS
jgi:predicted transcriptional regulator